MEFTTFQPNMTFKMKTRAIIVATGLLLPFQNCGPAFKTGMKPLSQASFGSRAEMAKPQVALVQPPLALSKVRNLNLIIKVLTDVDAVIASVSCKLDSNPIVDCLNLSLNLTNLADGDHVIKLVAADDKGNVSDDKFYNFRIDGTAPIVRITSAPAAVVGATSAQLVFTATDALSAVKNTECSHNSGAFIPCNNPFNLSNLAVGNHDVKIRATDEAGNVSPEVTAAWSIDLNAPILSYSAKPNAFSNSRMATFAFSGTASGVALTSYQCSQDGGSFADCTSPKVLSGLSEGNHAFSIKGVSSAGIASSALTVNWTVDTVLPTTPIIMANIASPTAQTSASFSFSSTDAGSMIASFQCSTNGAAFADCTSPRTVSGLGEGNHSFQVRSFDGAGNVSAVKAFAWTVAFPAAALDGKMLFANNCASCHNAADYYVAGRSAKDDRTAIQISAAITSIASMSGLKGLTTAQIEAIAQYIKIPVPTSMACAADFKPERAPVRLLSHTEYDNIAQDVFMSKKRPSADAKFVNSAAGSSGFLNTSVTSEANSPAISVVTVEKYLAAADIIADELIANKAQAGSGYSILAACAVGTATVTEACYDSIVRNVGLAVWRRPISETTANNEFARLKALLKSGTQSATSSTFDSGLKTFVKALLMSPHFIAVTFAPATAVVAGASFNLNDYQLASRLAFFLWASSPDTALLNAAKAGTLSQTTNLQTQVLRMLKDPKAKRFSTRMTNEWLGVNSIAGLGVPGIDANTLGSMIAETQYMFEDIMTSDVSFLNTVAADYSFLNKPLADYYGVAFTGTDPARFYKTSLATTQRRGVLNHASFLISTSGGNDKTHPVIRGKLVSTRFGCYEIAPPPGDLDTTLPQSLPLNATPAEVLAIHTQKIQCASCHTTLDPYGLPLETYDMKGNWRSKYAELGDRPIVTSGVLPSGERFNDTAGFMSVMASSETIRSCLVKKVMSAGLARRVANADDRCISTQISSTNMTPGSKFSDLIFNIVNSRQFKMQTTEGL